MSELRINYLYVFIKALTYLLKPLNLLLFWPKCLKMYLRTTNVYFMKIFYNLHVSSLTQTSGH